MLVKLKESEIKKLLISNLYKKHSKDDLIIVSEVPIGLNRVRADLVCLLNDKLIIYEVKSDFDDLRRLEEQIQHYKECFNEVYVICTNKHLNKIKENYKSIGILLADDNQITNLRKSYCRKKLNKHYLLDQLPLSRVNTLCSEVENTDSLHTKNDKISFLTLKLNYKKIHKEYIDHFQSKYKPIWELFLKEKVENISDDDLSFLSIRSSKVRV